MLEILEFFLGGGVGLGTVAKIIALLCLGSPYSIIEILALIPEIFTIMLVLFWGGCAPGANL